MAEVDILVPSDRRRIWSGPPHTHREIAVITLYTSGDAVTAIGTSTA